MELSDRQKSIRDGARGEASAMAMHILIDLAAAVEAQRLTRITHVHTDSGFYLGDAGLEFVEHLAGLGGRVAVPTTMNNTSYDIENSGAYGVPSDLQAKIKRLEQAHRSLGTIPLWTCAPYQDGHRPRSGQNVAWSESNAIVFANSILGARTNRTGDLVDICCALTGYAPETGLYLDENRKAVIHVKVENFPDGAFTDPRFYPLLGYHIGQVCGNRVVAVSGIPPVATMEDLKGFGAAAASSGATALFHIEGITPEAPALDACMVPGSGFDTLNVTPSDLKKAKELLWTAEDTTLAWVGLGCPHLSLAEIREVIRCMADREVPGSTDLIIFTSRKTMAEIKGNGMLDTLTRSGVQVYCDGCLLLYPQGPKRPGNMMSNSAKAVNYVYSQSGYAAGYGSISDCVASVFKGEILERSPSWLR